MSEPTGYVLTEAIDALPIMHLNPTDETACGGRKWSEADPTIVGSEIGYQQIDELTAIAMLENLQAIPCRRCEMKNYPSDVAGAYGPTEGG